MSKSCQQWLIFKCVISYYLQYIISIMFYTKKIMIFRTMYTAAQHHIMAHVQSLIPLLLSGPFPLSKTSQSIAPKMILCYNLVSDL
jgi:hypothetical protein